MIWLSVIWFVFAAIFLALGCYHWKMASKSISHLQVKQLMPQAILKPHWPVTTGFTAYDWV